MSGRGTQIHLSAYFGYGNCVLQQLLNIEYRRCCILVNTAHYFMSLLHISMFSRNLIMNLLNMLDILLLLFKSIINIDSTQLDVYGIMQSPLHHYGTMIYPWKSTKMEIIAQNSVIELFLGVKVKCVGSYGSNISNFCLKF